MVSKQLFALASSLAVVGCGQQAPTESQARQLIADATNDGAGFLDRSECDIISPGGQQAEVLITRRSASDGSDFVQIDAAEPGGWPSQSVRFERAELDPLRSVFDDRGQTSEYRRTIDGVDYVYRQSDHDNPTGRGALHSILFDGAMRTMICRDLPDSPARKHT
jgi:hypothetical protein